MVYTKQEWRELPDKTTPLSAERLNRLETQYDEGVGYTNDAINTLTGGGLPSNSRVVGFDKTTNLPSDTAVFDALSTAFGNTTGAAYNIMDKQFAGGAKPGAGNDSTAAINAALTASMKDPGSSVYIPAGEFYFSNLAVDYSGSDWPVQPQSGPPYGFRAPRVSGAGVRKSRLVRIPGSTGTGLRVIGKLGNQAGPGNNNKVTGFTLENVEIDGNNTPGNGLHFQANVNTSVSNVWVRSFQGSGIYLARETFVSGVNDEYLYALDFSSIKLVSNGRWGIECSGTNSVGGSFYDIEAIGNGLGGFYLAPTNITMVGCQAIGNGATSTAGRGLVAVRNTNTSSVNSSLNLISFRSEANSMAGGYEVELQSGIGYRIDAPSFYPTTGAHCLGVGVGNTGTADKYVQALVVTGGYYGTSPASYPGQKAIILGTDARETVIMGGRFNYNGGITTTDGLITDQGFRSSIHFPANFRFDPRGYLSFNRILPQGTTVPAIGGEVTITARVDANGKNALIAKFPNGSEVAFATST